MRWTSFLFALALLAGDAWAQSADDPVSVLEAQLDGLALPTHANLARTTVRLGMVDLGQDRAVDEYARLVHCDLYQGFFGNEFEWTQVRDAMRRSVSMHVDSFPIRYAVIARVPLGRYDFEAGGFRLGDPETLANVGFLDLAATPPDACLRSRTDADRRFRAFKTRYRVALNRPVRIHVIPVAQDRAAAIRERIDPEGLGRRAVVVRFAVSILNARPDLGSGPRDPIAYMSAHTERVEVFEDEAMTRRIAILLGPQLRQLPDGRPEEG